MIVDYINTHMAGFWIALGFVLMAAEVLILGFGTIIFLFAGIASVITGLLMMTGVLPQTWIASVASFGICTGVTTVLLWKPFKKMQQGSKPKSGHSSDLIGLEFPLTESISRTDSCIYRYSGVDWRVELDRDSEDESLQTGELVKVSAVDAGVFRVVRSGL